MTFSLLGYSPETASVGIAVQSKFPGVASVAIHGRAGVGVVATQGFSNPEHAPKMFDLLELGARPSVALDVIVEQDADRGMRQIGVLTVDNDRGFFQGDDVRTWRGHAGSRASANALALGNSLTSPEVLSAMVTAFESSTGDLATKLISGLSAGQAAGGEYRGVQAAGLLVFSVNGGFRGHGGKMVDISIYDHSDPIGELARCYELHKLSHLPSNPDRLVPISRDIEEELTQILVAEGYLEAAGDTGWPPVKIKAMQMFMGVENYDNRIRDDSLIDLDVLDDIRTRRRSNPR